MTRWLPHPMLASALFVMWLLLTQSFSPGQVLLGVFVAVIGAQAMRRIKPETSRILAWRPAIRLMGIVLYDILRSNLAVAQLVLRPRKARVSDFVTLPLDLEHRHGLTLLALIITATPGTIWVDFDRSRKILLVHVFDLVDEAEWVRLIKGRYETLLIEMFGR